MLDVVAGDMERSSRPTLMDELFQGGVTIVARAKIDSITDKGVTVVDKERHKTILEADTIVLALGTKSTNRLARELMGKVKELHVVGDAKEPRRIRDAISRGFLAGYEM